jgi:hypothetical protein
MQSQAQMAYWQKTVKLQPSKLQFLLTKRNGFYTLRSHNKSIQRRRCGWDKGMMKLYDNFTNDFLYIKPKQHFNLCGES